MSPLRHLLAFARSSAVRTFPAQQQESRAVQFIALAMFLCVASTARAQAGAAPATPLHLATSRFDFVASADSTPLTKPLRVHNGGTVGFTDVRVVKLTYADSSRGRAWLVPTLRQNTVAPDELAIVGTLCVDASGLAAGTYHAKAAVAAREVPEPVAFAVTLVVTEAGAGARPAASRCGAGAAR